MSPQHLPTQPRTNHHHPTGHSHPKPSPPTLATQQPLQAKLGLKSRHLQVGRDAKGAADARPKVDRVFTQRPLMKQVEWLLVVPPTGRTTPEGAVTKAFAHSSPNLLHEESDLPRGSQPMDEMTKVHHQRGDPARCSSTTTVPQNIAQAILAPPPWRSRNQQAPGRHAERPLFGFGN